MRVTVSILGISTQDVGEALVNRLRAIHPGGYRAHHPEYQEFSCLRLPQEDPRVARILDCLEQAGLAPWTDTSRELRPTKEFVMRKFREYDAEDWGQARLLTINSGTLIPSGQRDEEGRIKIGVEKLTRSIDIALASDEGWYIVPTRTKRLLETSILKGLRFRPTTPTLEGGYGAATTWPEGEEWWELGSAVTMPPLSPAMKRTDRRGRSLSPTDGDSEGFFPREGVFATPELRYLESLLALMPPWDLAKTHERMGNTPALDHRFLIASPRLYEFFREHGLKTGWIPVRIDPD